MKKPTHFLVLKLTEIIILYYWHAYYYKQSISFAFIFYILLLYLATLDNAIDLK